MRPLLAFALAVTLASPLSGCCTTAGALIGRQFDHACGAEVSITELRERENTPVRLTLRSGEQIPCMSRSIDYPGSAGDTAGRGGGLSITVAAGSSGRACGPAARPDSSAKIR